MTTQTEYSHLPHAATVARVQAMNILRLLRTHYSPGYAPDPEPKPVCRQFERCEGCPYPSHGFLCWGGESDCLRTRMEKIQKKESKHADRSDTL